MIHFEIPIDDSERALAVYGSVFGWGMERFGPVEYWTAHTGEGPGIVGALEARDPEAPGLVFSIAVDDIDEALAAVEAAGGERGRPVPPSPSTSCTARARSPGARIGAPPYVPDRCAGVTAPRAGPDPLCGLVAIGCGRSAGAAPGEP